MKLKPILLAIPVLLCCESAWASPDPDYGPNDEDYSPLAEAYIRNYQYLAVAEMERTAIPASITLAQGMLESGYGTSDLAKNANNHFGIKCHKGWVGETYTHRTKETTNGQTIARYACFRAYATAADSYADHSDFLASRSNYSALFLANTTDYEFWANGLVEGGYATDPAYARKLIQTIQTYQLNKYDRYTNTVLAFNNSTQEQEYQEDIPALKRRIQTLESILSQTELYKMELQECLQSKQKEVAKLRQEQVAMKRQLEEKIQLLDNNLAVQYDMIADLQTRLKRVEHIQQGMLNSDPLASFYHPDGTPKQQVNVFPVRQLNAEGIFYQSGRKATIASTDRNLFEIAAEYNISFKDLLRYNDLRDDTNLPDGYYVYLESKANYVKDKKEPHQVAIGETLHTIAQRYGIKANKLYQRNHLQEGQEPEAGEFIFLNKTSEEAPQVKAEQRAQTHEGQFGGGGVRQR